MKNNNEILTMKIPSEDKKVLNEVALSKGITLSGLIRMIYKEYLKKEEKDA